MTPFLRLRTASTARFARSSLIPHIYKAHQSLVFTRLASTVPSSEPQGPEESDPFFHKEWPQHHDPTPYEVLGIKKSEFDKKSLKRKYFKVAKLYHPDISANSDHVNHTGDLLTDEHKNERFKLLTEAYTLLKDTRKRDLYDRYQIGWGGRTGLFNSGARPAYASTAQYNMNDQRYWNASGWEDYHDLKDMSDPALRPDKMKALALIILFMVTGASIQGWVFLNNMEKVLIDRKQIHDDCESDLLAAYLNYGLDDSRLSRIKRFLWFRTFGLYRERDLLDRSAKENEILMKEVMGAK